MCFFNISIVKFYTAKMEIDKEFDNSINKIEMVIRSWLKKAMTLSLINWVRITVSILLIDLSKLLVYFHFRSVKLHYAYIEETHMMLVAFFAFVKFAAASQHKR